PLFRDIDLAVYVAGADIQEGSLEAAPLERLQQVQRPEQIGTESAFRIAEGRGNECLASKMDDSIGTLVCQPGVQGIGIEQVMRHRGDGLPGRGLPGFKVSEHMLADKTGLACDQQLTHTADPRQRLVRIEQTSPDCRNYCSSMTPP